MAAIIQADPYLTLSRKIGYSVGLEHLVDRVKQLASLYSVNRGLSLTTFKDLVERKWGRKRGKAKTEPFEHFANFYSTLNLVRLFGRELEPLYQLDVLAILRRLFESSEHKYDAATKVVLTQCIVEADGDIFLNGLLSDFRLDEMKRLLEIMVEEKRRKLKAVFRTPQVLARVSQIVAIKNQSLSQADKEREEGSTLAGRFTRRTAPLSSSRRTLPLNATIDKEASITEDYLDKVRTTRKSWAEDLGLFHEEAKTERGKGLVQRLQESVISSDRDRRAALFWGYKSDLGKIRVTDDNLKTPLREPWDLLRAIARACSALDVGATEEQFGEGGVVTFLRQVFELYREGRKDRGLIRNSLPLYVAEPVIAAWCVAEGYQLPPLHEVLEKEYSKPVRLVDRMIIRGTAGALFFKSKR